MRIGKTDLTARQVFATIAPMSTQLTPNEVGELFWSISSVNDLSNEHLDQLTIEVHYFDSNGEHVGTYDPHQALFTPGDGS